mgnify:CR=1 FL=1
MYTDPKSVYTSTKASTSVHDASPHKLISLLFEACLENLAVAKGAIRRGEVKKKIEAIKKAMDIVVRLQASLNLDDGGQVALNLDDLYTFCVNRLAMANASNDEGMIDEVFKVIAEIKLGWSQIEHANKA